MKFSVKTIQAETQRSQCLILPVYLKTGVSTLIATLGSASKNYLNRLEKNGEINGEIGSSLTLHNIPDLNADRLILVGCGEQDQMTSSQFEKVIKQAFSALSKTTAKDAICTLMNEKVEEKDFAWKVRQSVRWACELEYKFDQLKSGKQSKQIEKKVILTSANRSDARQGTKAIKQGEAISEGIKFSRDLANLPGNYCTPTYLAEQAKGLKKRYKALKIRVLTEANMEKLGMGSLLSVSRGSVEPAKFIIMEHKGKSSGKPVVLVGKGVTFDTGGISLKPGAAMDEMKYDMCGAASVMGAMVAVAQMELPINLIVIVPAVENMPGGKATKPGDIVTSLSGQTIEVLNTDAEGRLILCDALTYSERFRPEAVIDVATLTGACVVALGSHATGLISNNDQLAVDLLDAGVESCDKAWRMPLWDEYQPQLDSNFADMANIGGREAGMVTAGCFLSRFTKKLTWAHLDIAGVAWQSGKKKGASGRPVSMLVQYLINKC